MNNESIDKPHLSSEYYKARRNYNFYAALLFAWEFVGIELPSDPWGNINIKIKSPEAAPYILLLLVIFFAFRFSIEWHQSDSQRRALRVSKIDFYASHAVAILAVVIFSVQLVIKEQVFEIVLNKIKDNPLRTSIYYDIIVSIPLLLLVWNVYRQVKKIKGQINLFIESQPSKFLHIKIAKELEWLKFMGFLIMFLPVTAITIKLQNRDAFFTSEQRILYIVTAAYLASYQVFGLAMYSKGIILKKKLLGILHSKKESK